MVACVARREHDLPACGLPLLRMPRADDRVTDRVEVALLVPCTVRAHGLVECVHGMGEAVEAAPVINVHPTP